MTKYLLFACCLGGLVLAGPAVPSLAAQSKPDASSSTSAAPKGAHPKSGAERAALSNLSKLAQDPATTGDQLDAAITDFVTKYPTSDYLASVSLFGLQYYQTPPHQDYAKTLVYGEQALKYDPKNLFALSALGDEIPNQVKDTDLDRDQRLKEAADDDNQAIAVAAEAMAAGSINGKPFTQAEQNEVDATAYSSLARIATIEKKYADVIANYQKAIPLDDPAHQAGDYFYMARAQISLKQYPEALASLDAAEKADPTNPQVQAAVDSNKKLVQQLQAGAH